MYRKSKSLHFTGGHSCLSHASSCEVLFKSSIHFRILSILKAITPGMVPPPLLSFHKLFGSLFTHFYINCPLFYPPTITISCKLNYFFYPFFFSLYLPFCSSSRDYGTEGRLFILFYNFFLSSVLIITISCAMFPK